MNFKINIDWWAHAIILLFICEINKSLNYWKATIASNYSSLQVFQNRVIHGFNQTLVVFTCSILLQSLFRKLSSFATNPNIFHKKGFPHKRVRPFSYTAHPPGVPRSPSVRTILSSNLLMVINYEARTATTVMEQPRNE